MQRYLIVPLVVCLITVTIASDVKIDSDEDTQREEKSILSLIESGSTLQNLLRKVKYSAYEEIRDYVEMRMIDLKNDIDAVYGDSSKVKKSALWFMQNNRANSIPIQTRVPGFGRPIYRQNGRGSSRNILRYGK